jgi:hypothetical protein
VFVVSLEVIQKVIKKCNKIDMLLIYHSNKKISNNEELLLYTEEK